MKLIGKTNIDFVGNRYIYIGISIALFFLSIFGLVIKGVNLGIDFKGGVLMQVKFDQPQELAKIRNCFDEEKMSGVDLQSLLLNNAVIIRIKGTSSNLEQISNRIKDMFNKKQITHTVERLEFVGPKIGKYLTTRAVYAIILSWLGIIVYVAFRFKSSVWGVSGVVALVHDTVITLGLVILLSREVTLTVIAAFLTLIGYSINDTIVVFDRIRENLTLMRRENLGVIINASINQTLSRTIITSLCTELVIVALFFLGGEVIHDFALVMGFGIIIGTYSSIFIASPIVYEWTMYNSRKMNMKK